MKKLGLLSLFVLFAGVLSNCESTGDSGNLINECRTFCQKNGEDVDISITKLTGKCRCTTVDAQ